MKELQPNGTWKKIPTGVQTQKFVKDYCRYCGATSKLTGDHVIPKSRGGAKHVSNLQPLCEFCNGNKGNFTEVELVEIFLAIRKRGVWYEWEHRFADWLNWLETKTSERNFDSKLLMWISDKSVL